MFKSARDIDVKTKSKTSSESSEIDDTSIIDVEDDVELDLDVSVVVDVDKQKPHFLDYDAMPPAGFEENFDRALNLGLIKSAINEHKVTETSNNEGNTGEQLKLDKKFERDGEISDYELAASGYTKKEFTQDDNTLHIRSGIIERIRSTERKDNYRKPKHFLDENPIPPDYMIDNELREHRSLDRNFERSSEYRANSTPTIERKNSFERLSRSARCGTKFKEPFYTLSGFLDNEGDMGIDSTTFRHGVPKGGAWADRYDSHLNGIQLSSLPITVNTMGIDIDTLGPKVECVYSLLSMLGSNDTLEMSKKFLELSRTPETCATLRRSGCIPLLVQMMHSDSELSVRKCAGMALHNVVHSHPDEKAGRREAKVLRLLDQLIDYCNFLKTLLQSGGEAIADDSDRHPLAAISSLMKVSFDEEHRHAMCELGALQAIPSLVHLDHAVHGPKPEEQCCNSLRRYALMALTNLTFGDENNKALLCSQKLFMEALVVQLDTAPDDLLQVTASVLRNLSWRADNNMKTVLNEIGTVTALARAAMKNKSENTLKAILSALWNLSAHCSTNKGEFCAVVGALAFLVDMLTYEGPSKTLKIIENAGGILRNVSSHIAVREHYRQILREKNCLAILLQQLKSESLTVVSNSCGTLWNLSARCPVDQKFLWDNGAVPMLRSLIHSKHAMISEGSSSALKNLLNFRPSIQNQTQMDHIARSMGLKKLPTLNARKQKALEQELGEKEHAETCDNLDIGLVMSKDCTTYETSSSGLQQQQQQQQRLCRPPLGRTVGMVPSAPSAAHLSHSVLLSKSESRDSVFSTKSDSVYENLVRSHAVVDGNSKAQKISFAVHSKNTAFALDNFVEPTEEQPINYSIQYNENLTKDHNVDANISNSDVEETATNYATYQETDIDQPTDFSLRYAENQVESDVDISSPEADIAADVAAVRVKNNDGHVKQVNNGSEILLILQDTVKCYQTEDTPYVISNAASVTDLHQNKTFNMPLESTKAIISSNGPTKKFQKSSHHPTPTTNYGSGSYTPEKPINYCEEGTPGYFSRHESLSSLDESPPNQGAKIPTDNPSTITAQNITTDYTDVASKSAAIPLVEKVGSSCITVTNAFVDLQKSSPNISTSASVKNINLNSAQETPLMFSRHSSMDSLVEEDIGPCDDKSSVISDFSRMASGVISPSDIPDSPTQSMPQSPRRNSGVGQAHTGSGSGVFVLTPRSGIGVRSGLDAKQTRLRSVFEDDFNTFHVENTPAQFSCATSLSNLSILDDDNLANHLSSQQQTPLSSSNITGSTVENLPTQSNAISEGEEDAVGNNDDLLLANCINIGMSCTAANSHSKIVSREHTRGADIPSTLLPSVEVPTQYYTEDTPALLSKVGSNTNLSTISINSNMENKNDILYDPKSSKCAEVESVLSHNRHSLNLSDDVSSNASEAGGNANSMNILEQCIRDGMKKLPTAKVESSSAPNEVDPIAMMKSGGNVLPNYLPVSDETNKFLVEDTPCNFSIVSGLSNLTVGSSIVGPAIQVKGNSSNSYAADTSEAFLEKSSLNVTRNPLIKNQHDPTMNHNRHNDDSLSSLSNDSEDDTNLLSQAIAAGCNRPKSNLGFSSSTMNSKRTASLSASQPIAINSVASTSSLTSTGHSRSHHNRRQHSVQNNNDSYSSVDSSDSNDNQSKSLFELCILSGMNKRQNNSNTSTDNSRDKQLYSGSKMSVSSNPNLKMVDSLNDSLQKKHPEFLKQQPQHQQHQTHSSSQSRLQRERERKDEQLLMECINTGISKKISGAIAITKENVPAQRPALKPREAASSSMPKNAIATSAVALEQHHQTEATTSPSVHSTAAPDVEMNIVNHLNTNTQHNSIGDIIDVQKKPLTELSLTPTLAINSISTNIECQSPEIVQGRMNVTGCKSLQQSEIQNSDSLDITESDSTESFIMETTFSIDNNKKSTYFASNKHKDPDLMLKSVERLTQEFVSSAEQSRINGSTEINQNHRIVVAKNSIADTTSSTSNNTWNEDTCPNDISFPSVSVTAPVVGLFNYSGSDDDDDDDEEATDAEHRDLNDFAEITPTNEEQPSPSLGLIYDDLDIYAHQQLNSIDTETETETLVNDNYTATNKISEVTSPVNGINFMLGGKVQTAAATRPNSAFLSSAMHHSAIIAMEARDLAENFLQTYEDSNDLTYSISSLDLDNIRPPSCMDSMNISGYYQDSIMSANNIGGLTQHNSMQKLQQKAQPVSPHISANSPKFPRKSLPAGIVARRALGQLPGGLSGSAESVNSSCNFLDNIKPPSLMDELLDSMMSVASIQSEIADCESLATTLSLSNYETAAAGGGGVIEIDDNTVTLHSCCDTIPHDDNDEEVSINCETLLPSDNEYTSAESTPKKSTAGSSSPGVKRTLTPKQKRKLVKDRYKTYTIAADIVLNEVQQKQQQYDVNHLDDDEKIHVEIEEYTFVQEPNMQNVGEKKTNISRYQTQNIVFPGQYNLTQISEATNVTENGHMSNNDCTKYSIVNTLSKDLYYDSINTTGLTHECEFNSLEHDQNSETESCHGLDINFSDIEPDATKINIANGQLKDGTTSTNGPRILKPANSEEETNNTKENVEFDKSKAIRGRKKPAYVSPYSMQFQRNVATRSPTKSIPTPTSTSSANQNKTTLKTTKATGTTIIAANRPNETSAKPNQSIERQGTFVKEKPTASNIQVPIVGSTTGQQNNLSPSRVSKLPTKKQIPSPSKHLVKQNSNVRKLPTSHVAKNVTLVKATPKATTPQRSNSNATLRITSTAVRNAVLSSRVSTTTPPSRSNSNLNGVPTTSTSAATSSTAPLAVKISQAQSRIAGIWKRVDEAKTKQQKTKSPEVVSKLNQIKAKPQISTAATTKQKLIRSTTFDTNIEPPPKQLTAQTSASKGPQNNSHHELRHNIKTPSLQSKIAVNKSTFTVTRKENMSLRK